MNQLHAMIDIETFSQLPTAAVISIGAVTFDKTGIKDTFKVNIKPESAREFGMTISADTVDWWSQRPKEVQEMVLSRAVTADFGLKQFHDWYTTRAPKKVWAQGVAFDMPILDHAFKCVQLESSPWKWWDVMDSRTLFSMFGIRSQDLHAKSGTSHHDALEDCKIQAGGVIELLNAMGWSEPNGPIKI